ncbi:MAG: LysM peptidoglycan-binding domain-containing protein [Caldilineales bacterium]
MRKFTLVLIAVLVLSAVLVLPAAAQTTTTYVVQPGDTLASIARQFCTTWQQIYHMNRAVIGPNPNVLRAGTVLVVPNNCGGHPPPPPPPGGGSVPCDRGPSAHAKGPINGNVYTVTFGDTMFSISRRFCTTVPQLSAANGISNPWLIFAGQRLVIPGGPPPPVTPTPPPQGRFLTMSSPTNGQVVPLIFPVSGTGAGLFENNVVVTAFTNGGQQLAQVATTMQVPGGAPGGAGTWQASLTVNVAPGTAGYVEASSPQSNVQPVRVSVTYGSGPTTPFIAIQAPANNAAVVSPFTVSGTGAGLFENNVVVSAFTNGGQLLARVPTTMQVPGGAPGGAGTWQVSLAVNVAPGTAGYVEAASPQSNVQPVRVSVTYGSGQGTPFIDIQSPAPNATVTSPFTVSGVGAGLFNTTIVVQAFNNFNVLLNQQTTVLQGSQVPSGGQGTWSVIMSVNVPAGTAGHIHAFSPQYGVQDQVVITYGLSQPSQCSIVAIPGAPYFQFPGGALTGNFGPSGGTFPVSTRTWFNNQFWYPFTINAVQQWAPTTSISGITGSCIW